ncbi:Muskelin 1, intracellular mediator containing kelch motif [Apophysomyces sp. BC1021]|nr:Muskelin 1, intracellular mediator containing kelch motif [Apophysomyces sp. BC1021]
MAAHVKLPYAIFDYSSHSGSYYPQNIYHDKPTEQSSRWSSGIHDHKQFIILRLDKPVVARTITFGKFHRSKLQSFSSRSTYVNLEKLKGHVCNLKEFKIFGGMQPDEMAEILHQGLRNDNEKETFRLRHVSNNLVFPVQFIKIVPLSTFGDNFNYSIWYVELNGIEEDAYKEEETVRLCLKHFRQLNLTDVFHLLKRQSSVQLEHPLLTQLHQSLVVDGDFLMAENIIREASSCHLFKPYADNAEYSTVWRRINATTAGVFHGFHYALKTNQSCASDGDAPGPRGGHQMCIDTTNGHIYLFGGWNGKCDLSDFWYYSISESRWHLLSPDTKRHGGPSARSCHKICFDPISRSIFVLGRYVESHAVTDVSLESDFYQYFVDSDYWIKISSNTAREGGPELLFDHQMCVDPKEQVLYVFGGRVVSSSTSIHNYSGLFSFHIISNTWRLVRNDMSAPIYSAQSSPTSTSRSDTSTPVQQAGTRVSNSSLSPSARLKSRIGHSMLFDPATRDLYIFASQRSKDNMSNLYRYSIDTEVVTEITEDFSRNSASDPGYTQRVTMDIEQQEFYVYSGYMRSKACNVVKHSLWVYNLRQDRWERVYENESRDPQYHRRMRHIEPCPRFAHQMVYDPTTKAQYVFGGNPGDIADPTRRLSDFWELRLVKPDPESIVRRCLYLIRIQKLRELCSQAAQKGKLVDGRVSSYTLCALDYLQNKVTPLVNHTREDEVRELHELCAHLCVSDETMNTLVEPNGRDYGTQFERRTRLFGNLMIYFPRDMKEPEGTLVDVVKLK